MLQVLNGSRASVAQVSATKQHARFLEGGGRRDTLDLPAADPGAPGDPMRISSELLVHLRLALLGAIGAAIENLSRLNADLQRGVQTSHADLPRTLGAYHEQMAALRARYELQETVGLPGDELRSRSLPRRAQRQLVTQVLEAYRDAAALVLRAGSKMSDKEREEAVARVEEITAFIGDGLTSEDGAVYAYAIASLTAREAEIAALIIAGERTEDIAAALAISVHTVYSHVKSILRKMRVSSRSELRQVLLSVDNTLQKVVGRNLMPGRS